MQNVEKTQQKSPTSKPYKLREIAYKNLDNGKVEETKILQFSDVFKQACDMQAGMSFTVTKEKVGDYWNWTKVEILNAASPTTDTPKSAAAYKSTYETPEERARRQVLIVRQSSLSAAVAMLTPGAKGSIKKEDTLLLAQQLADWVFSSDPGAAFDDIPDEVGVE